VSMVSQAAALATLIRTDNEVVVFATCALFGFSVGNLITLPSLIISREFNAASFGVLVGLSVAINQVIFALGPGAVGWLRDLSGSYSASLMMCITMELLAAAIILIPFKKAA
jgi:cyanate permease